MLRVALNTQAGKRDRGRRQLRANGNGAAGKPAQFWAAAAPHDPEVGVEEERVASAVGKRRGQWRRSR